MKKEYKGFGTSSGSKKQRSSSKAGKQVLTKQQLSVIPKLEEFVTETDRRSVEDILFDLADSGEYGSLLTPWTKEQRLTITKHLIKVRWGAATVELVRKDSDGWYSVKDFKEEDILAAAEESIKSGSLVVVSSEIRSEDQCDKTEVGMLVRVSAKRHDKKITFLVLVDASEERPVAYDYPWEVEDY